MNNTQDNTEVVSNFQRLFGSEALAALTISQLQQNSSSIICPAISGQCSDIPCGSNACLEILHMWLRSPATKITSRSLIHCPFCKGTARIEVSQVEPDWYVGSTMCTNCFAQVASTSGETPDEAAVWAARAWNTRAGKEQHNNRMKDSEQVKTDIEMALGHIREAMNCDSMDHMLYSKLEDAKLSLESVLKD